MRLFLKTLLLGALGAVMYAGAAQATGGDWIYPGDMDARGSFLTASSVPREEVRYETSLPAGTIVVSNSERRLYLVLGDNRAIRYGVGVGRPGFSWAGTHSVTMKREWPDWRPPAAMRRRQPDLPVFMPGGENNPLGARALYIGSTLYRIHGSNEPHTIGDAVSSGCIRMTNQDVEHLYERVRVGARVIVRN